jgi:hypothetical protein
MAYSPPRPRTAGMCAFETFERRLESTSSGHCKWLAKRSVELITLTPAKVFDCDYDCAIGQTGNRTAPVRMARRATPTLPLSLFLGGTSRFGAEDNNCHPLAAN